MAAVLGPYAAAARHDLLDWPIVGPVARAWGVVGVKQSDIRERQLRESEARPTANGSGAHAHHLASMGSCSLAAAFDGVASALGGALGGPQQPPLPPNHPPQLAHAPPPLVAPPQIAVPLPPPQPSSAQNLLPSSPAGGASPGAFRRDGRASTGFGGAAAALSSRAALPGSGALLPPVLVFPEATTSAGGCVLSFRSGAFLPGLPVLPCALKYSHPGGLTLSWTAPHDTGRHFWRIMAAWGKTAEITFLPLHFPPLPHPASPAPPPPPMSTTATGAAAQLQQQHAGAAASSSLPAASPSKASTPATSGATPLPVPTHGGSHAHPPSTQQQPHSAADASFAAAAAFAERVRSDVARSLGWPRVGAGVRDAHALFADVSAAAAAGRPLSRAPPFLGSFERLAPGSGGGGSGSGGGSDGLRDGGGGGAAGGGAGGAGAAGAAAQGLNAPGSPKQE